MGRVHPGDQRRMFPGELLSLPSEPGHERRFGSRRAFLRGEPRVDLRPVSLQRSQPTALCLGHHRVQPSAPVTKHIDHDARSRPLGHREGARRIARSGEEPHECDVRRAACLEEQRLLLLAAGHRRALPLDGIHRGGELRPRARPVASGPPGEPGESERAGQRRSGLARERKRALRRGEGPSGVAALEEDESGVRAVLREPGLAADPLEQRARAVERLEGGTGIAAAVRRESEVRVHVRLRERVVHRLKQRERLAERGHRGRDIALLQEDVADVGRARRLQPLVRRGFRACQRGAETIERQVEVPLLDEHRPLVVEDARGREAQPRGLGDLAGSSQEFEGFAEVPLIVVREADRCDHLGLPFRIGELLVDRERSLELLHGQVVVAQDPVADPHVAVKGRDEDEIAIGLRHDPSATVRLEPRLQLAAIRKEVRDVVERPGRLLPVPCGFGERPRSLVERQRLARLAAAHPEVAEDGGHRGLGSAVTGTSGRRQREIEQRRSARIVVVDERARLLRERAGEQRRLGCRGLIGELTAGGIAARFDDPPGECGDSLAGGLGCASRGRPRQKKQDEDSARGASHRQVARGGIGIAHVVSVAGERFPVDLPGDPGSVGGAALRPQAQPTLIRERRPAGPVLDGPAAAASGPAEPRQAHRPGILPP